MPPPDDLLPSRDVSLSGAAAPGGQPASPSGTATSGPVELNAWLGPDTAMEGTLSFAGNMRVDGEFQGKLLGGRELLLGPGARVNGELRAQRVIVLGSTVRGDISATESIELRSGARVEGDLRAPSVQIDPDIEFRGRCEMGPTDTSGP